MSDIWECEVCVYWEIMNKVGDHAYKEGQFLKCSRCTRPFREHMEAKCANGSSEHRSKSN